MTKLVKNVNPPPKLNPYEELSWDERLGLHIQLRRRQLRITQRQICKLISMTYQQVSDRETGRIPINAFELEQFAKVLQCSAESLKPREEV